jgi:hypothetical protein
MPDQPLRGVLNACDLYAKQAVTKLAHEAALDHISKWQFKKITKIPPRRRKTEMAIDITTAVAVAATLVMFYAVWRVIILRRDIPGGMVGRHWNLLAVLVILFAAGYLGMPFAGQLSREVLQLIVALIFLFGAIYVVITINLIHKVIRVLSE